MNTSSLSSSPIIAADLSQRNTSSSAILHREDSLNKVYPHLLFAPQQLGERSDHQEHLFNMRERFTAAPSNEKEEKRLNPLTFKRPIWDSIDSNPVFSETHQHYEAPFYPDANATRIPPLPPGPYDISPLLLKESGIGKHERGVVHPPTMNLNAAFIGSMYKPPPQRNRPVNAKTSPVDLDDLSEDERERMRVKRERNRVAAAKCRNRRRELLERLEKEAEQLEREQDVLRDTVKKLQAQKRRYGSMLENHEPGCTVNIDQAQIQNYDPDPVISEPAHATDS